MVVERSLYSVPLSGTVPPIFSRIILITTNLQTEIVVNFKFVWTLAAYWKYKQKTCWNSKTCKYLLYNRMTYLYKRRLVSTVHNILSYRVCCLWFSKKVRFIVFIIYLSNQNVHEWSCNNIVFSKDHCNN